MSDQTAVELESSEARASWGWPLACWPLGWQAQNFSSCLTAEVMEGRTYSSQKFSGKAYIYKQVPICKNMCLSDGKGYINDLTQPRASIVGA